MGSGASASKDAKDAPHLVEYFKRLKEKTDKMQEQRATIEMAVLMGGGTEEMKKWYEEEGKPCLIKSFEHHDKDNSKSLSIAEAKVFFLNLAQEHETFALAMAQAAGQKQLEVSIHMFKSMLGAKDAKYAEKDMKTQLKKAVAAMKKDLDKRIAAYKKHKDERDEEAFRVMDTSSDGKIQLAEFLATLSPESDKNAALLVALGFMTEQEKLQHEQMKVMLVNMTCEALHLPNADRMIASLRSMVTDKVTQLNTSPGFAPSVSHEDQMDAYYGAAVDMVENPEHLEAILAYAAQLLAKQDGEARVSTVVATHEELNAKLCTPLSAAFRQFDLDADELLSKEEAAAFFTRYVQVAQKYTFAVVLPRGFSALVPSMINGAVNSPQIPCGEAGTAEALEQMEIAVVKSIFKQLEPQVTDKWAQILALFDGYSQNVDASNTKAFDVVDSNSKGKLSLDAVFAAFLPAAPQNQALTAALGLNG